MTLVGATELYKHVKNYFEKKIKAIRPEKGPQGQNLTMLQHAQFFFLEYLCIPLFPSNFEVRIGAFWYFFQNWPNLLHKNRFFRPLRPFLSSLKAL